MSSNTLSGQLAYAALLRYSPETEYLRNRAIDNVVLGALLTTTSNSGVRAGRLQKRLKETSPVPRLQMKTITDALRRLHENGLIHEEKGEKGKHYHISTKGKSRTRELDGGFSELLKRQKDMVLKDFPSHEISKADNLFDQCLVECFSRLGRTIADMVLSGIPDEGIPPSISNLLTQTVSNGGLSLRGRKSLIGRVRAFLTSRDPSDSKILYQLTQAFYLAQLLELDTGPAQFNPLAKSAFDGAVFYVDSNVVIRWLLDSDGVDPIEEVKHACAKLNISLKITRETKNEITRVAHARRGIVRDITDSLPDELIEGSPDEFLKAFRVKRESYPELTPDKFLERFENAHSEISIDLEDVIADDIQNADAKNCPVQNVFLSETVKRGRKKGRLALRHDAFHYFLVQEERKKNLKTWFLTLDQTVLDGGARLVGRQESSSMRFCYPALGLMQAISPFVVPTDSSSVPSFFSALLRDELKCIETGFKMEELGYLAKNLVDIESTSKEGLSRMVDIVDELHASGKSLNHSTIGEFSVKLKGQMNCSANKTIVAQQREIREERQLAEEKDKAHEEELRRAEESKTEELRRAEESKADEIKQIRALHKAERDEEATIEASRKAEKDKSAVKRWGWITFAAYLVITLARFGRESLLAWLSPFLGGSSVISMLVVIMVSSILVFPPLIAWLVKLRSRRSSLYAGFAWIAFAALMYSQELMGGPGNLIGGISIGIALIVFLPGSITKAPVGADT